jgi:uncharacterized membrane protein (DUF373 family)
MFANFSRAWKHLKPYEWFEQAVSGILLLVISLIIVYTLAISMIDFSDYIRMGKEVLEVEVLKDTFGSLMTVLILLEFNHSIALSMRQHSGVIQARVVVLIAILVLARKLILFDYKSADLNTLVIYGGLAVALGVLYWLILDGESRRHPHEPASHHETHP